MHDTAMAAGAAFFEAYLVGSRPRILDVGAMNVNGSLRSLAPEGADYVGLDLEAGLGVDVVLEGATYPFEADSFDACVSVSCLEHDAAFWDSFLEMARVCRPGGFVFLDVPSNGPYHAYPHDNWRFYPDAGLALERWAQRAGQPMQLIESGTLRRRHDVWNDLVMVFQKAAEPVIPTRFLLEAFPDATNARRLGQEELINPTAETEDIAILDAARQHAARLEESLREAQARLAGAEEARAALETRHAEERQHAATEQQRSEAERLRLARDLVDISARLAATQAEAGFLAQRVAGMAELEADHARAKARLAQIEQSRSWRITRPLRQISAWFSSGTGRTDG
jgi:SAM-dependent methyltransferase